MKDLLSPTSFQVYCSIAAPLFSLLSGGCSYGRTYTTAPATAPTRGGPCFFAESVAWRDRVPGGRTRLGRLCSLALVGRQSRRRTTPTKNPRCPECALGRAKAKGVNPYRKSRSGAPSRQIDVVLTCLPDNSCNQAGACRNEKHYAGTPPVRSRGEAWRSGNPGLPYTCPSNRCFSSIFCTLKALGRWAIGDGDRRRKALEVTSHKPALRRSRLRWSFSTHVRQEWGPVHLNPKESLVKQEET